MNMAGRIAELIGPTVESLGYELVRVQVLGRQRPRVQVMAERSDRRPMAVDDCVLLSQGLSPLLDVEDPIRGTYTLEISSPGLDRPLVRLDDYRRFTGYEARLELGRPLDGRRRFQGRLLGVEGEVVRLNAGGSEVCLRFADIERAKLVLSDELLAGGV